MKYSGSCHCDAVHFEFYAEEITTALRCNCSMCKRRGAAMSDFFLAASDLVIKRGVDTLRTYQFGTQVAKHYFCGHCGIYPFHETMRKPGYYRVNLGCVEGIDAYELPCTVFDGKDL